MWISGLPAEVCAEMIRRHPCCGFMLDAGGRIIGANKAFQTWSNYDLVTLQRIDVSRLHITSEQSPDDLLTQCKRLSKIDNSSVSRTQFRANGEAPVWGRLRILRIESSADSAVYFWCVWEPVSDENREPFELALKTIGESSTAMIELQKAVQSWTARDQDEDFVVQTIRFVRRYPKMMLGIVMLLASVFGVSNVVQIAKQLGLLPPDPVIVEPKQVIFQQQPVPATGIAESGDSTADLILSQPPITVLYNRQKPEEIRWLHPDHVTKRKLPLPPSSPSSQH